MPGLELAWDDARRRARLATSPSRVLLADRDARDRFRDELDAGGIQTHLVSGAAHLHRVPPRGAPPAACPRPPEAADRHCALPLSATMDEAEVELVVATIRRALS